MLLVAAPRHDVRSSLIGFGFVNPVTIDTDLLLGRMIGNFRLVAKIGSGGMGAVYRAEHILLGKPAAVKVLLPERCSNPEIVDRFFNEAKASSLIRHPGIVDIFDFGRLDDGNAYIVMELLDGESLGDRLRREQTLGAHAAASIARHVAGALAAAHGHGIVHRDLKPDNVFLVPDPTQPRGERAKVLDFGIAKLQTTAGDLVKTDTGRLMGTPYYMSPEQCRGAGRVDHRTDLYSLGCVLYQMLTGRPPFVLEGAGEILAAHIYEQPQPPSVHEPSVPAALEAVVMRLLLKDLNARYQSMTEVVSALNEAVVKFAGEEHSEPTLEESEKFRTNRTPKVSFRDDATTVTTEPAYAQLEVARRRRRGWPVIAAAGLVAAAALALIAVRALGPGDDGREAPPTPAPALVETDQPSPVEPVVASLAPPAEPAELAEAPERRAEAAPRAEVSIVLTSDPDGALVYREVDGVRLGKTPLAVPVMRGPGEAAFVLKRSGYRSERVSVPVAADLEHHVVLRARRAGDAPGPGDAPIEPPAARGGSPAPGDAASDEPPPKPKKPRGKDDALDPFAPGALPR
jgi:eukaryotic-like serine/threonine-protein kinase